MRWIEMLAIGGALVAIVLDKKEVQHNVAKQYETPIRATDLIAKQAWSALGETPCPLSVDAALEIARRQFEEQFPAEKLDKTLSVSCSLSREVVPDLIQDLEDEIFIPRSPQYWRINFLRQSPLSSNRLLDVTYVVFFDRTIIRPVKSTKS